MVNFNGIIVNKDKLSFEDTDRMLYGDGFFETLRFTNGVINNIDLHYERIKKAIHLFKFDKSTFTKAKMLLEINRFELKGTHRIRLSIFRKSGGKYLPQTNEFNFLLEFEKLENEIFCISDKGKSLGISLIRRFSQDYFKGIKVMGSNDLVVNSLYTVASMYDELLMLNEKEQIVECTSSNIFFVKKKEIFTPHLDSGCVDGVVRRKIISLIKNDAEFNITECLLLERDLKDLDEIFITNAISGVVWINEYKKHKFNNEYSKKLINLLNASIKE